VNKKFFLIFAFFLLVINAGFGWADGNFLKRRPIEINSTENFTDFQVKLNITYDSDMQPDFDDLRFYASDDTTKLPYWIEEKSDSNWAVVWIKGNWTTNNGTQAYLYYGNASATSESNATEVFEWFIGAEGNTLIDSGYTKRSLLGTSPSTTITANNNQVNWTFTSAGSGHEALLFTETNTPFTIHIENATGVDNFGVAFFLSNTQDGYGAWLDWTSNEYRYYNFETAGDVSPSPVSGFDGTTSDIDVEVISNSNIKIYDDGVSVLNSTTSVTKYGNLSGIYASQTGGTSSFFKFAYARKYAETEPTYSIGNEEGIAPEITIYHPANTTYSYSNHTFNFSVLTYLNPNAHVKAWIDGNLTYDNSSYINNTIIDIPNYILNEGSHNFTVWVNETNEATKTIIFATKYHDVSTSMNTEVFEGTQQDFILNISVYDNIFDVINATLSWNGTEYNFTNGNYFKKTLTMPLLDSIKNTTVPVFWKLWVNDSFNIWQENTTVVNQTIFNFILDDCSTANIRAYNFTIKNEQTRNLMNGNVTFALYYGLDGQFNQSFENKKYVELCIYPNTTLNVTGQVIYEAGDYPTRSYYLINNSADYLTDTITLSLLHSNYAYEMPFTVYDENNEELEGAYILLERWYPETMSYQSVAMGKTDSNGKVSIPLERGGDAWYRITVIYNGRVVKVESQKQFYTSETSYTLNVIVGTANTYYNFLTNVQYDYNWTGKTLYLNVVDNSGSNPSGTLLGWNEAFFKNNLICNSTGSGNSFTLLCDASGITGPATFTGTIIYNGQKFVVLQIDRYFAETTDNFGNDGLLATAILVGVSAMFMIWDPVASVISAIVGLFGAHLAGFYSISNVALISMVFVGVFIIYLLGRRKNG